MVLPSQPSAHEIEIVGNPDLMFDFHRLPSQAKGLDTAGNAIYYKLPETYPIYIKIKIYLKVDAVLGLTRFDVEDEVYFFKNHYEVTGVVSDITEGAFTQKLILKRTDDVV
jgi:hypothetical protein